MENDERKNLNKNTKTYILLIISLIAVFLVSATLAYLTDIKQKANNFSIGSVSIILRETTWENAADGTGTVVNPVAGDSNGIPDYAENMTAGQTVSKDPKIVNDGLNEAFVYIKVKIPKANLTANAANTSALFTLKYNGNEGYNSADWGIVNGYTVNDTNYVETVYYYKTPLSAGSETTPLFDQVTMANIESEIVDGQTVQIDVKGFGIQTNNLPTNQNTAATAYTAWLAQNID